MRLVLTDRCTASEDRKPAPLTIDGGLTLSLVVSGDSITLGNHCLYRIEPHGFGDVHWQLGDVAANRFTHIEAQP